MNTKKIAQLGSALALLLVAGQASAATCNNASNIQRSFANGSTWDFCWEFDSNVGIVLSDIHYTTTRGLRRRMMKSVSLAQLDLMLSDGSQTIRQIGNMGANSQPLNSSDCPDGLIVDDANSDACVAIRARGYASKYYSEQSQGQVMSLSIRAERASGIYVQRMQFYDDGTFEGHIGHGGNAKYTNNDQQFGWPVSGVSGGSVITGFTVNAVWRIDTDIGESGDDDSVEIIEIVPSSDRRKKNLVIRAANTEFASDINPNLKRSWRVLDRGILNNDSHPVSLHLEAMDSGHLFKAPALATWSSNDVYVTRYNGCEQLASRNPGGCASGIEQFVNGESIASADVVLWYRSSFYRLPRSEDRAGFVPGWSGFRLTPRDWTATSTQE